MAELKDVSYSSILSKRKYQQLAEYTRIEKYATYVPSKKRRETWREQCYRVMNMHKNKYNGINIDAEIKKVYNATVDKKILGSQRALQFGGLPILKKNTRIYNCAATYVDRTEAFQQAMFVLLCGTGVGFSFQDHHINKLPPIKTRNKGVKLFKPEDSIEGWADCIGVLMSSYFLYDATFPEYSGYSVKFDLSSIRPKGSMISDTCNSAPGPEPLQRSLDKIENVMNRAIDELKLDRMRPIDAYDVMMHLSDAVLAGGVRRSATIAIFSPDNKEMVTAKTGDWFITNPQRARSNISALLLRDSASKEEFHKLFTSVKEFGEPGFIWADSTEVLFNPCVEACLYGYDRDGRSGFQFCNLAEINMKAVKTPEDFYDACEAAALISTMQAGYTDFGYLGDITRRIVERERLLGISMTGMMDCPGIAFDPVILRKGVEIIKKTNEDFSKKLGFLASARLTCVKPAGSTSCILDTSSGVHPAHSKKFIRRVQAVKTSKTLEFFRKINPEAVEESVWSNNKTDDVISFLCVSDDRSITKSSVSSLELLEKVKFVQENWVMPGRIEKRCAQPYLCHNVSNTINVEPDQWEAVENYIYTNREYFSGVSLLSSSGDKDYHQAPFQKVMDPVELVKTYGEGALFASGLIIHAHKAFNNKLYDACSCLLGIGEKLGDINIDKEDLCESIDEAKIIFNKKTWIARANKFAKNFFRGDVKKMVYCLKDVDIAHKWSKLDKVYKPVNWAKFTEEYPSSNFTEVSACGGGACELIRF